MATSQPTEIQAEGEVDVNEAVKEILAEMEAEEQDPLEGMGNAQIAEIYNRIKPEDQRLFRQFKRFHKRYYETQGHDAPSHQLTHSIVQQMFPGLPSADAETIANARAELLAAEQLKELCKQLGLAVPTQLQACPPPPEAPEYPPPPQPPRFLSRQDKERAAQQQSLEEAEVKSNVKPRRLATSYLGPPGLLRMIGSSDEDHIITRVVPGMDPMQDFEDDHPHSSLSLMMTPMHQVMWMTSQKSNWPQPVALENKSSRGSCQTSRHSTSEWQLLWTPWPQGSKTCQWSKLKRWQ